MTDFYLISWRQFKKILPYDLHSVNKVMIEIISVPHLVCRAKKIPTLENCIIYMRNAIILPKAHTKGSFLGCSIFVSLNRLIVLSLLWAYGLPTIMSSIGVSVHKTCGQRYRIDAYFTWNENSCYLFILDVIMGGCSSRLSGFILLYRFY